MSSESRPADRPVTQVGDPRPAAGRRARNPRGQGGRLRGELIAAGREQLSRAGAESELTIRSVTRTAGVHPQAFYLHFDSLDQLLYAVYTAEFAELIKVLETAASAALPGPPALRALGRAYARFALAQPGRYRLLMSVPGQPHPEWEPERYPGSPALRLLVDALAASRPSQLNRAVASGTDSVAGPERRGPHECAVLLWASLHGLVSLRVSRPAFPWPPIEQQVDSMVDGVLSILI
jgi:AcrR family transcriptional regulator